MMELLLLQRTAPRLKLSTFDPSAHPEGCLMHPAGWRGTGAKGCAAERRAMQSVARTGKPAGYSWRLWWDPRPRVAKPVPTGSLRMPRWAYPTPAYLVEVPYPDQVEAQRQNRIQAWQEGRNPNAWFDTAGYLAHYGDVAAAGMNPLAHYEQYGWQEGRDPSAAFDTLGYLAANPDVAAAHINPLDHFINNGIYEGRAAINDGLWH